MEEAPEEVKKVLSLEFGRNKQLIETHRSDLIREVQRHRHDFSSLEVTIAALTVQIRNHQGRYDRENPSKDTPRPLLKSRYIGHITKSMVDHRRVLLRYLRERDHKKFEWLLEKLDLYYRPRPFTWERIERREHLGRLVDLWCQELKEHRLNQIKREMEEEMPKFLRKKAETLR
jgi:ribosomal protein S15P/S13E